MPSNESSGVVPGVNVGGSQGVQMGSGNVQHNHWAPKPQLDPVALRDLNPHVAVARLQQLPHDELVNFFVRAQAGDLPEILDVFAGTDLHKVVTVLGDLNRRKATELISALNNEHLAALLGGIPEAAEMITRKAGRLKWTAAEPLEEFAEGYARKYYNGHVCWAPSVGATTTTNAIDDYFWSEIAPEWGFPIKDQESVLELAVRH